MPPRAGRLASVLESDSVAQRRLDYPRSRPRDTRPGARAACASTAPCVRDRRDRVWLRKTQSSTPTASSYFFFGRQGSFHPALGGAVLLRRHYVQENRDRDMLNYERTTVPALLIQKPLPRLVTSSPSEIGRRHATETSRATRTASSALERVNLLKRLFIHFTQHEVYWFPNVKPGHRLASRLLSASSTESNTLSIHRCLAKGVVLEATGQPHRLRPRGSALGVRPLEIMPRRRSRP